MKFSIILFSSIYFELPSYMVYENFCGWLCKYNWKSDSNFFETNNV